ncbi:MAG TPA: cysteine desulfurase-like protein [Ktedonobacterales bacterium]
METTTTGQTLDTAEVRRAFPSLALELAGAPVVYFDNPGGTQVTRACADAITAYLMTANANTHGAFITSERTDALLAESHAAMADFLNASDPHEIVFGPNMTTLTFAFSRSIGRTLQPDDEVVVTALDHDANVSPWRMMAEDRGATLRMIDVDLATCTLDMADARAKITPKTKVVAVGYASNAVGTINDVATIVGWAHEVGALVWVDAVQYAPHAPIDVQALGCDFLACSAYKFFGPHQGIVWGKREHLEGLTPYKVRPASESAPDRWETGTQAHELQAGTVATLDYLASVGQPYAKAAQARFPGMEGRRLALHAAMEAIQEHEVQLITRLLAGLKTLPGATLYGLVDETDPEQMARRVPTVSLTVAGHTPRALAEALAQRGVFAWDGNYYALTLMERLGLEGHGGALRLGLAHYNTAAEVDRVLAMLREIVEA